MNTDMDSMVADLIANRQLWWGWTKEHGWVVLDRQDARNDSSDFRYPVRCDDWTELTVSRGEYGSSKYAWFKQVIQALPNEQAQLSALRQLQKLRAEFEVVRERLKSARLEQESLRQREEQRRLEAERIEEQQRKEADERARQEKMELIRRAEQKARQDRLEALRQAEQRRDMLAQLRAQLQTDFPNAETHYERFCSACISRREFEGERARFMQTWAAENIPEVFPSRRKLDLEQAAASSSLHSHVQVVARAGSGKTATLVARTCLLQKHCGVPPSEILLVAFNRKAADEMRVRLERLLAGNAPHVMTFHALAYALIHPEEALLYNEPAETGQSLSRAVQSLIDDRLQIPDVKVKIRELMLAHFREDWERIVAGGYDRNQQDLLQLRRSLPRETLRGEYVKSFGEKTIADCLFEHDINYVYERNHRWGNINYRPDFTIFTGKDSGVVIEYFGLTGDPDYDKRSQEKRNYWGRKPNWSFLEFGPQNIKQAGVDRFTQDLKSSLEALGIRCKRLSEDEIWHRVRQRAIDRFTKAMETFIGRCRKRWLTPEGLTSLVERHAPLSPVEGDFLQLAHGLYVEYLNRLLATSEDDFDGLMQRAAQSVADGNTAFERRTGRGDLKRIRHILIDEYQDFSELFFRLVEAIRKQSPQAQFFCVGDDWQAINGFAGSDLRFYESFSSYFAPSQRLHLLTNYRSNAAIVEFGNRLMDGLGKPAVPSKQTAGQVLLADLSQFEPSALEKERHPGDDITPVILRLASKAISANQDIVLLSRRNTLPWFVNYQARNNGKGAGLERYLDFLRSYFPEDQRGRLTISTAHKYKGLESSVVVVLDAVAGSYPLVHPDWIFSRVLGDTVEKNLAEERRLFYVAATRAVDTLILITEHGAESPFLQEVQRSTKVARIEWAKYPPVRSASGRLVVKVGNQDSNGSDPTLAIKVHLRAEGFRWHSTGWRAWTKSFAPDGFSIDALQESTWGRSAHGVEVRLCDEQDNVCARYLVNAGQWHCVLDRLGGTCGESK